MRERLREVAEMLLRRGVELLGEQAERRRERAGLLEDLARFLHPSGGGERGAQPERAGQEGSLAIGRGSVEERTSRAELAADGLSGGVRHVVSRTADPSR